MISKILKQESIQIIQSALNEDMPSTDLSSELCIDSSHSGNAQLLAKEAGIFCGDLILDTLESMFEKDIHIQRIYKDGSSFKEGDIIAVIKGNMRRILGIERILLNFCQRLSGIASTTNQYVNSLNDANIQILDTRKTTPGLRNFERYAVRVGGGHNHRLNLSDMVLIKENHIDHFLKTRTVSDFTNAIKIFKRDHPEIKIEIEIETIKQLENFDLSVVDIVLLDNFDLDQLYKAIPICQQYPNLLIEISGNVSLDSITQYKGLPIHRISIGRLTHSVKNIDLSLLLLD